jgi:hypothetical protein
MGSYPRLPLRSDTCPRELMVEEGTDGLSSGMWLSPQGFVRSSILEEATSALGAVRFSLPLQNWVLTLLGHDSNRGYPVHYDNDRWEFNEIYQKVYIWVPTPEVARQALVHFLQIYVEFPTCTEGIFIIPRVLQRDRGNISRAVVERGVFHPTRLPKDCRYSSLIPFVGLHVPPHQRVLPSLRLDESSPAVHFPQWHTAQADHLRKL